MATLLYDYFSQGIKNDEIKFSSFIRKFIVPLEGDDESQRRLAFSLLDHDQNGEISVPELIRVYLGLPKYCALATEIRYVFRFYMENYMKHHAVFKRSGKFDIYDFKTIVPESCLKLEIHDLFVYRVKNKMSVKPKKLFESIGDPYDQNNYIIEYDGTDDSVFFENQVSKDFDDEFYDHEIKLQVK